VLLAALGYVLIERLRALALQGTALATAQVDTLRVKLLKLAAVLTRNTRRIRLYLASNWPSAGVFMGSPAAGIVSRINGSLEFTEKLFATNPTYLRANPSVQVRLKSLQGHSRQYLAHEYFNQDWAPMYFADVAKWLEGAKLTYACSAHYLEHVDPINLADDQRALLGGLTDQTFRETVRDYMVNQQFRRDYWVKGSRKLPAPVRTAALRAQSVVLTTIRADVPKVVNGALGECSLQEDVYNPILDVSANHSSITLGEIEQQIKGKKISFAQLVQSVTLLSGINQLTPAQDPSVTQEAKAHTEKLNAALIEMAAYSADITYLASPVTGGGIPVGRFGQLFLQSIKRGAKTPQTWARHAWVVLLEQNYRLTKDGRTLESPEENLQELTRQANEFAARQLPILTALKVV
jgi:hypothetical protein